MCAKGLCKFNHALSGPGGLIGNIVLNMVTRWDPGLGAPDPEAGEGPWLAGTQAPTLGRHSELWVGFSEGPQAAVVWLELC